MLTDSKATSKAEGSRLARGRRIARVSTSLIAVAGAGAIVLSPATARADSAGCSGNACISVTGVAGGNVTVEGWVGSDPIQGTLTITAPGGFSNTTTDQKWNPPGDDGSTPASPTDTYTFTSAWTGQYCVQVNDDNNDSSGGEACEGVHG
jgi:hypothetical protein